MILVIGPLGLVTLKNLLEKGFEVTGFDKTDVVGGLWNFRDDDQTTVLESRLCSKTVQFSKGPMTYHNHVGYRHRVKYIETARKSTEAIWLLPSTPL